MQGKYNVLPNGLTVKQARFVKEMVITGNASEATRRAYNATTKTTNYKIAKENLRKPKIQDALQKAYKAAGLTEDSFANYLKENIVAGLGVKAKASDSLRGLELYAKTMGFVNRPQQTESYSFRLHKLPTTELRMELTKRISRSSSLMNDVNRLIKEPVKSTL